MQAIQTYYLAPTNHRDGRIVAKCGAGKVTLNWIGNLGIDENHLRAAKAMAIKLNWDGDWVGGTLPDGSMVWVNSHKVSPQFSVEYDAIRTY